MLEPPGMIYILQTHVPKGQRMSLTMRIKGESVPFRHCDFGKALKEVTFDLWAALRPEAAWTSSVGCSHQRPLEANKGGAAAAGLVWSDGSVEADVERLESRTKLWRNSVNAPLSHTG